MNVLTYVSAVLIGLAALVTQAQGEVDILTVLVTQDFSLTDHHSRHRLLTNQLSAPVPPPDDSARMARFIVHYSVWGSLSHISKQADIYGSPLARVYSISDGPIKSSSGVPYFFMTPNDPELIDIYKDNRASLTLTLAQTPYCRAKAYDPEDPRCAQVILTGNFVILKNDTAEWENAKEAMFSRHPVMKNWPSSHKWVFCKLDIKRILVADNFGGNKYPSVEEYFKAKPDICSNDNPMLETVFF